MRKVAFLLALFIGFDAVVDSFDSDCVLATPAASCHSCLCQVPSLIPPLTTSRRVLAPKQVFVVAPSESASGRLSDKRVFQPPRALS